MLLYRGPTGVTYDPPALLDCTLAQVEAIVQEEAAMHLGSKVVRIANAGAYACRPRNFRKGASLSAHAFGSALDLTAFHPAKGTPAVIDRDYSGTNEARRAFLRAVYTRLRAHEADLTYVVGPAFNAQHHNHFHLDRGGWSFWGQR
ncbi:MAG: extensin family protein [Labilithrix sp.]|nr:extensin family protein [Labilithrix sp.]MCW5812302.1 extensin family protein [Labilithrix sp.]